MRSSTEVRRGLDEFWKTEIIPVEIPLKVLCEGALIATGTIRWKHGGGGGKDEK